MSATAITTALAALTTVFTPPCSTSWLLTAEDPPSQFPPFPTPGPVSCDPPNWAANLAGRGFQFYSPAICPSGFGVGPGCQITKTRTAEGFPAIQPGETAVYCVPSGMSCTSDTTDFRGGVWGATTDGDEAFTLGPAMQIRFQQSDLSSLETHPLTSGLTLSSVTTTVVSTTTRETTTTKETSTTTSTPASPSATTTSIATSTSAPPAPVTTTDSVSINQTATATSAAFQSSAFQSTNATQTMALLQPSNLVAYGKGIDNGSPIDGGLIAVIVSIVVASIAIFLLIVLRMRGSRLWHWLRGRFPWGSSGSLVSVGVGAWIGRPRRAGDEEHQSSDDVDTSPGPRERPVSAEAESAAPARPPSVVVAGEKPLGSADNPAELPAELEGDQRQRLSQRASWVSRMLSRVARSSTTTRSTSPSRWTQRSLARSGGWETFIEEEKGEWMEFEHELLSTPGAARPRPATMFSSSDMAGHEAAGRLSVPVAMPTRFRSFDRLSQGTFGMVKVRGRSPSAGPSTRE